MKKVLKLKFKTEDGKPTVITINNPKQDLKAEEVKAAMTQIVNANAFVKDGYAVYKTIVGAHYYTSESQNVFTEDLDAAE